MSDIEIDGFEEVEELLRDLEINESTKRKAVKSAINIIADSIEENSPKKTGRLSKIKRTVKNNGLAMEGICNTKEFYDLFMDIGTSQQKAHVGYFERAVDSVEDEAIEKATEIIFSKVR